MLSNPPLFRRLAPAIAAAALLTGVPASAQVTPAAGYTPPDDTPSIKVGGVIFTDYTYQDTPAATDADKNTIHPNSFDVKRGYVNVTGNISHLVAFRVTTDITRQSTSVTDPNKSGVGVSSNLDGSLTVRLKYAYGQINFDDFAPKGSWVRLGLQQTPWVDFAEGVYRYRFQGTVFTDREGYLTSSDFALSTHWALPDNYGDVHVGVYNGDGYTKGDANDQKALQARLTLRPLPKDDTFKGLRLTAFYDGDHFVKSGDKKRFVGALSFEHERVNLSAEYVTTTDQSSATKTQVKANGYSIWATPKLGHGIEGLLRYDSLKPDKSASARKKRFIGGVAYWFPVQKGVSAALLADYEQVKYDTLLAKPEEKRYALHALFQF